MLPGEIAKTKWSKKAKEVLSWDDWWEMHEKVSPANITRPSLLDLHPPLFFLSKDTKWCRWVDGLNYSIVLKCVPGDLSFKIVFTVWSKFTG